MNVVNFYMSSKVRSNCIKYLKKLIKGNSLLFIFSQFLRHPFVFVIGYLYGSYLTIRYVDKYSKFPAIVFRTGLLRLGINKGFNSQLHINARLIVQPLNMRRTPSSIVLGENSSIVIDGEFTVGDDVQLVTYEGAQIFIGGRSEESGSGVSGKCLIHARSKISVGKDAIIAQDTIITDSDWHPIKGQAIQQDVIIGNHVWIAVGAKVLKGSQIGDNCIVGCGAVVVGGNFPCRTLIAGVPGNAVKNNIPDWTRE